MSVRTRPEKPTNQESSSQGGNKDGDDDRCLRPTYTLCFPISGCESQTSLNEKPPAPPPGPDWTIVDGNHDRRQLAVSPVCGRRRMDGCFVRAVVGCACVRRAWGGGLDVNGPEEGGTGCVDECVCGSAEIFRNTL